MITTLRRFSRILVIAIGTSLVFHILFIFYMPPIEEFVFFSTETESHPPIQLSLQGSFGNNTDDSGITNSQKSVKAGEFSGSFDIDSEKWANLIAKLEDNTGMSTAFKANYDDIDEQLKIKKSYIQRARNHEDLVVKDVFPTIRNIEVPFAEILATASLDLQNHNERNKIITAYRDWLVGQNSSTTLVVNLDNNFHNKTTSPLVFPKQQRKKYFDENIQLSKELQLSNFIREFTHYDPNEGDLPIAIRELYYDNLQRLAYSFSSDPSFLILDYFLENLNKEDFLKNALYQAAKLKESKTQTELLFAIENIYHIQQRAWKYYFDFEQLYGSLPDKNKQYLRNETLRRVVAEYQEILVIKKVKNYADIERLYRKKRKEILDYIISHTPNTYRDFDAQFERIALAWEEAYSNNDNKMMEKSVKAWSTMLSNELRKDKPSEVVEENLSRIVFQKLTPELSKYLATEKQTQKIIGQRIQHILLRRHAKRLAKKRKREEELLWP